MYCGDVRPYNQGLHVLRSGTRLGPYVVDALIGQGGMGEVYRAHDPRLKRDVALKLLPPSVANDPDRLLRFEREAQMLASLNNANIAGIHGIENAAGTPALVMELVEGLTLADRLTTGPILLEDALPIAQQIAAALEVAHEAGIIHRDVKPANVKVRPDGSVKVLDFGLAKAADPPAQPISPASAPTITSPAMTRAGMILGSASYMAPEQARGKAVDRRADIWAFGCVLYEMLAGMPAFPGDNITDVLASVVKNDPDWNALPADTPPRIRRLLARCLKKDPAARLRDIGDARLELDARDETDGRFPAAGGTLVPARPRRLVVLLTAALAGVSLAFVMTLVRGWRTPGEVVAPIPTRLAVTFPAGAEMHVGLPRPSLALSPDGRTIVYTAGGGPEAPQLWSRHLETFEATPLAGTRNARMATFSPDGRWIAFFADGKLKKIPISTGPPTVLCDAPGALGATWTAKDEIVFSLGRQAGADMGLWRVAVGGGQPQKVAAGQLWFPDTLPGGNAVVVTTDNLAAVTSGDLTVASVDLASGTVTRLFDGGTYARYAPTGHLVYLRNGALMAVRFDAATSTLSDERRSVVAGVYMDPSVLGGNYAFSVSGALLYVPGDGSEVRRALVTTAPEGARPLIEERRFYNAARISPDGRRVAVMLRAWRDDVWTIDLARAAFTRITTGGRSAVGRPLWSHDGRHVAFALLTDEGSYNLFRAPSDGSGSEERLTTSPHLQTPNSFSPDGKSLVFTEERPGSGSDLFLLSMEGSRQVQPLLQTRFAESAAAISPDGRWIAFQSDRSGRAEVYVARFPSMTSPVQVSSEGGIDPVWAPLGRSLYFNRGSFAANIEVVDVDLQAWPSVSKARSAGRFSAADAYFDVMADGRFLFVSGIGTDGSTAELRVVLNWFDELRRSR
jgi:Tol biopolymer transport system component